MCNVFEEETSGVLRMLFIVNVPMLSAFPKAL